VKIKNVHIFGGGTVQYFSSHFALCAPAYGQTARQLETLVTQRFDNCNVMLELTKMASKSSSSYSMETNEDVERRLEILTANPNTKVIFFSCALCDYKPDWNAGKYDSRLDSHNVKEFHPTLVPTKKIISSIRKTRKDIFLVGFKETCGASRSEMYQKGLRLCKESSVNLVLVNDTRTRWNMIVTPEEAAYHETADREEVLKQLVDMAYFRSHLTFTQSTVIEGSPIPWNNHLVPNSLRTIVNYCVSKNAYKAFNNSTVGHFAVKLSDTEFLTSIRKSNFNNLDNTGLVYVKTDGPDTVIAYGAKPSVGGQSQRTVFRDHEGMDCIVHFHCPLRNDAPDDIPIKSQREVECGSHECGKQTSEGLKQFGNLKAVYLDNHGPNIIFNSSIDPQEVIEFIERNFDLSSKTGGYNLNS
jgi:hypothetical protein